MKVERDYYDEDESSLQLHSINLYATKVKADFPTNESIITKIKMGTAGPMDFEVDTAASHRILSYEAYRKLKNMPYGDIPNLSPETKNIKLADGTVIHQLGGVSSGPALFIAVFGETGPRCRKVSDLEAGLIC